MTNEFVVLSDLHGNYPALQTVVDREGKDREYMVLGDIHGLNAHPSETQELVQEVGNFVLAGNHDKAIFHHNEGHVNSDALSRFELSHTLDNLSDEQQNWMRERPFMEVVQRGPSRIALAHAYPWPAKASGYEAGNAGVGKGQVTQVASTVSDDYDYVFHGHTHTQYELDCSQWSHDVHFVNPGSLGYDGNYAVVETDHGGVSLKSVELDMESLRDHVGSVLPDDAPSVHKWHDKDGQCRELFEELNEPYCRLRPKVEPRQRYGMFDENEDPEARRKAEQVKAHLEQRNPDVKFTIDEEELNAIPVTPR